MIQVKNSLILDDRFYLPLQIFLNQEKNLYYLWLPKIRIYLKSEYL